MLIVCAFFVGFVAGLRTFLAPAIVSWAARFRILVVAGTPLAWMGASLTPFVFAALSVTELVFDKLPMAGSRKAPRPFLARILAGGLTGATIGAARHSILAGLLLGAAGAVAGTLLGSAGRAKLASFFRRDWPAAVLEDLVGIAVALFSVFECK